MGITEVIRGSDLLLSTAQQIHLYRLLGYPVPAFAHLPLLCNEQGVRLSKRDRSLAMDELRRTSTPAEVIGRLAHIAGLIPAPEPLTAAQLLAHYQCFTLSPTSCGGG